MRQADAFIPVFKELPLLEDLRVGQFWGIEDLLQCVSLLAGLRRLTVSLQWTFGEMVVGTAASRDRNSSAPFAPFAERSRQLSMRCGMCNGRKEMQTISRCCSLARNTTNLIGFRHSFQPVRLSPQPPCLSIQPIVHLALQPRTAVRCSYRTRSSRRTYPRGRISICRAFVQHELDWFIVRYERLVNRQVDGVAQIRGLASVDYSLSFCLIVCLHSFFTLSDHIFVRMCTFLPD